MKRMSNGMIALIVVAAILIIIIISSIGTYNSIASAREGINTEQSNIDTTLQRRADLIPNLVNSVKGITAHEKNIVDSVTKARAALVGAGNTQERLNANADLQSAISRLLVVVENYPQIKASEAYTSLMDELSGTENRISYARQQYNDKVKSYNSRIIRFPAKIIAGMFGFEKVGYFTAKQGTDTPPTVDFTK